MCTSARGYAGTHSTDLWHQLTLTAHSSDVPGRSRADHVVGQLRAETADRDRGSYLMWRDRPRVLAGDWVRGRSRLSCWHTRLWRRLCCSQGRNGRAIREVSQGRNERQRACLQRAFLDGPARPQRARQGQPAGPARHAIGRARCSHGRGSRRPQRPLAERGVPDPLPRLAARSPSKTNFDPQLPCPARLPIACSCSSRPCRAMLLQRQQHRRRPRPPVSAPLLFPPALPFARPQSF